MHRKMKLPDESLSKTKPVVADILYITHLNKLSAAFNLKLFHIERFLLKSLN
jgi:hypothetical protein